MEIEQVAEMARAVAALPKGERDFFDGMVADERARAADVARIAKLRAMSDLEVISAALDAGVALRHRAHRPGNTELEVNTHKAEAVLRDAGFVRTGGITLEQAFRAGFRSSAEGWNYEIKGEEAFARQAFKDEMASELASLKPGGE